MQTEVRKFLSDIQKASDLIGQFLAGKSRADYEIDLLLRSAVERQFMIVGEALCQALKLDPSLGTQITGTVPIVGFRNILVHGYALVNNDTVWSITLTDLPLLRQEVDALLAQP